LATNDLLLDVAGLSVRHGRVPALSGIDLQLRQGEAIGLLGANGAGKTTLLNALSGFLPHEAGAVRLFGRPAGAGAPHRIARAGLLQVSQDRDLFGDLSVRDNLRLGCLARAKARYDRNLERVFGYFPRLQERMGQRASTMSGGEQQMLAIGRALMAEPRIILLDEPSAGLSPLFVQEIGAMMQALKREGEVALVLVEQNMRLAAQVVDRFYMLRAGQVVAQGPAAELERDYEHLAREYYL